MSFGILDLLGVEQMRAWYKGLQPPVARLKTGMLYKLLRHPMYVGVLLAIWATPRMTVGHLLLAVGMTIYVVIPPAKLGESGKLLNIFFSTVVGQNLKTTPQEDPSIKHQVLLLMDEFTAMGRVNALSERISITAGYWVRDLTIIQSNSQLRATYGADAAQNYVTNHAASIVFTPREQQDAEDYSKMLGDTTVRRRQRTVGKGGTSWSHTEERRPLMLPQELKGLPNDDEIIFYEGCPPIRCRKNWYFKSAHFRKRVLPPVEIKPVATATEARRSVDVTVADEAVAMRALAQG